MGRIGHFLNHFLTGAAAKGSKADRAEAKALLQKLNAAQRVEFAEPARPAKRGTRG